MAAVRSLAVPRSWIGEFHVLLLSSRPRFQSCPAHTNVPKIGTPWGLHSSHTLLDLLTWEIINMPPTEARAKKYFIAVPSRPSRKKVRYVVRGISVPLLKLEEGYLAK